MSDRIAPIDRIVTVPATRHRDYIASDYAPRAATAGRLQAQSVFRSALRAQGLFESVWPICERVRALLGPDETVWGIKYGPAGTSVELYFYNPIDNAEGNPARATGIAAALAPSVRFPHPVDEGVRYFMCSFEIDAPGLARGEASPWRVYVRTGEKARRECGFSYRVEEVMHLENHYWFYFAQKPDELADVVHRLGTSFRAGSPRSRARLLPPALRDCHTVCYATKPRSDSLYYSRISTEQLRWFLTEMAPHPLVRTIAAHADDLAHLSWDVGVDFCAPAADELARIDRFGLYGIL